MAALSFRAIHEEVFETVVVGTGFAGFAAAQRLWLAGRRVLLLDHRGRGDLLYECSRAFATELQPCEDPAWMALLADLRAAGAANPSRLDGALTEIVATRWIRQQQLPILYYTVPIAAECDADGLLASLVVGSKSGARRIMGQHWIDATGEGLLPALLGQRPTLTPTGWCAAIHLQGGTWDLDEWQQTAPEMTLSLHTGLWPEERILQVQWDDDTIDWWQRIEPALRALHLASPAVARSSLVSHLSSEPLCSHRLKIGGHLPPNVVVAGLGDAPPVGLTDRFVSGLDAVDRLTDAPPADARAFDEHPLLRTPPDDIIICDVLVAGAGTAGAIAAISAARHGARTLCVEPLNFAGGISTGGGIHSYYYGFPGGVQNELDERVQQAMPLFAGSRKQVQGFHPDARKIVLHAMLREAGVTLLTGATLIDVTTRAGWVEEAFVAHSARLLAIHAHSHIDCTGDGDLAAGAGADSLFGRQGDGNLHAYSQSSGRLRRLDQERLGMVCVNFDAGWVDPTEIEDLTRARLDGILHYWEKTFSADSRPTYIAPAIGLRQGRQIVTDYVLTLSDLVEQRHFSDAIGRTGAHYENHAVDYEYESDEALFWVWGCHAWRLRTYCELPYRIMLPRGLDNVWIACRAAGVSADAHHSMRMQRDMQRLGEAAGIAAALAVKANRGSREIPWPDLSAALHATGALDPRKMADRHDFGIVLSLADLPSSAQAAATPEQVAAGMEAVREGRIGPGLWYVYRADPLPAELESLLASENSDTSWCAALVLAIRGNSRAETRLLSAIRSLEDARDDNGQRSADRLAPRWLAALGLLRCCGTAACIPVLEEFARRPRLALNVLTTVATTTERLLQRLGAAPLRPLIELLLQEPVEEHRLAPQRPYQLQRLEPQDSPTAEAHGWQLALMQARLAAAVGIPADPWLTIGLADPRALVRRQFAAIDSPGT